MTLLEVTKNKVHLKIISDFITKHINFNQELTIKVLLNIQEQTFTQYSREADNELSDQEHQAHQGDYNSTFNHS